jgi:hypothetical protein
LTRRSSLELPDNSEKSTRAPRALWFHLYKPPPTSHGMGASSLPWPSCTFSPQPQIDCRKLML